MPDDSAAEAATTDKPSKIPPAPGAAAAPDPPAPGAAALDEPAVAEPSDDGLSWDQRSTPRGLVVVASKEGGDGIVTTREMSVDHGASADAVEAAKSKLRQLFNPD